MIKIRYSFAFPIIFFAIILNVPLAVFGNTLPSDCIAEQEVYNTSTTIYHGSSVEPTIAVNPKDKK